MPRAPASTGLTIVAALVASCGIPGTWTGETADSVTLYTDEGITACAGVLPRIVRLRDRIANELGVDPGAIDYYFSDDTEKVAQVCRRSVPGCAFPSDGRVLYSDPDVVSSHELAHVLANRGLDPVPLTSEGLAVYFSDVRVAPLRLDVLPALNDPLMHDTAGAFVSYLIQEYGLDEVFTFHKETWRGMSEDDFVRLFEDRFGISIEDVENAVDDDPSPLGPPFAACDGPGLESNGNGFERRIACDEDALGVQGGAYTHDVVHVDAGTYRVRVEGADEIWIRGCVSGSFDTWFSGLTYFAFLAEGDYSLQLWAPEGEDVTDVRIQIEPYESVATCTTDTSVPAERIDPPEDFVFSVVEPLAIPFEVSAPALLDALNPFPVQVCTDFCECARATGAELELEPGRRYWLQLPEGERQGYARFSVP